METVGLFEAKSRLSELVERAAQGQRIGFTRRGRLTALIVPARSKESIRTIFEDIERIRRRAQLSKGRTVRDLIEAGRV